METVLLLAIIAVVIATASVKRTAETERAVIFRLGRFSGVRGPGRFTIVPFIDQARRIDLRPRTITISTPGGPAKVTWRVIDPAAAVTQTDDYSMAVRAAAEMAARHSDGRLQLLRGLLNERLKGIGIAIEAVES